MTDNELSDEAIDKLLFVKPEDLLGTTMDMNGEKVRLTAILGSGAEKVVYELTNLATGKADTVLAYFRANFDPEYRFFQELRNAITEQDNARIVRLSERFLEHFPDSEPAAFNKAVGLLMRGSHEDALQAIDLAISLNADDVTNWTYKARISEKLDRREDFMQALAICAQLDVETFQKIARHTNMYDEFYQKLSSVDRHDACYQQAQSLIGALYPSP
jgi:tetratricopeptide (TPR) repeat protein